MKKIKLLLLADSNSPHTVKWARFLAQDGNFEIYIFSFTSSNEDIYINNNIKVYEVLNISINKNKSGVKKLKYLLLLPKLLKLIKIIKPDIVHAHYASSYGLLGSLSFFHPFIISAWGSDIFDFPNNSLFHKLILKFNFYKSDRIISTSHNMAKEMKKYTTKLIEITPFGVDTDKFRPQEVESLFEENDSVIGTIKSLEPVYGIAYLIRAFSVLCKKHSQLNLRLLIVGDGSLKQELIDLCSKLNIRDKVVFTGYIKNSELNKYYNMLDVFVALSLSESFGVAVIEASSCEVPVVVSNVGGLPEVVVDGKTGFVVPSKNVDLAVEALEKLIKNTTLRKEMGKNARSFVKEHYNWNNNAKLMVDIYKSILKKK